MADEARLTSLDALETFRSSLIIFLSRGRRSLDETSDELRRVRQWLHNDRRFHWEQEVRRWQKALDQAQQELLSARISGLRDTTTGQQQAVNRARRGLAAAEDKQRLVRRWVRDYDGQVDPIAKRLNSLRNFLEHDLPKAIAYLAQMQRTLDEYAERTPASRAGQAETEDEMP